MNESKLSPGVWSGIIVALFFAAALYLRVYFPYDKIFTGDWIKFATNDSYYHMHLVDNLVHNFPRLMSFDPYLIYPEGAGVGSINFFWWLLAGITWVIGLGSPTQHTVDVVGVYFPAVLGALTVIPVYFIGKELWSRWVGVLAAGLIALLPGEFLGRTILGAIDNPAAEILFTTVTMLLLILAVKSASQRGLTFSHLKRRDWATSARPLVYSLLTGLSLGIYLLTWQGGLLFVFLISVYFVIQFIIDHLKGKTSDYLCLVGVVCFFIAGVMFLTVAPGVFYLAAMVIALLIPLFLRGVSWLMAQKKLESGDYVTSKSVAADYVCLAGIILFFIVLAVFIIKELYLPFLITALFIIPILSITYELIATKQIKLAYYPLTLLGLGLAGWGLFYLVNPSLLGSMLGAFSIFFAPTGATLTTSEAQPLISPIHGNPFRYAWGNFPGLIPPDPEILELNFNNFISFVTTSFFFSLISLGLLIYLVIKQGGAEKSLLVVWSLVTLAAMLGQRRFAYYFAINAALLTGYLSWRILEWGGLTELTTKARATAKRTRDKKTRTQKRGFPITVRHVIISFYVLIIFVVVFAPNVLFPVPGTDKSPTISTASAVPYVPSDAWVNSLAWLRENSPDPFDNPDFYYELPQKPPSGESYQYPESAYGVMSWWDYGYLITRVGRRIPNANPSQDPRAIKSVASFFTAQDEELANEITRGLGASYIVIDYETALTKFWAMTVWAGKRQAEFWDFYYVPQENQPLLVQLFYPEYYRSLSIRLYNFDGKAATPESTLVISYQEKVNQKGELYKEITSAQEFDSYEEAEAYLLSQESANYKIVGINPFVSPVPLEVLEHYRLVHSSNEVLQFAEVGAVPQVKIFEYIGDGIDAGY